ncbi:MAG TPA: aldose epimerase family protein, partial [Blastocatellia bacterium]|nr:aldose epimerase family protein [Blastocatellia bacterium]
MRKTINLMLAVTIGLATMTLANINPDAEAKPKITKQSFGKVGDTSVDLYTLTNDKGMEVKITNYGGIVTSIKVPDRNKKIGDVVLGFDDFDSYLKGHPFFGAIAGRYANRIAKGRFTLDGKEYTLPVNNGVNSLHGGLKGFDKVVWSAREVPVKNAAGLELKYLSKDGEEGYPGNLSVTVIYSLNNNNELKMDYSATTDKATVINLTNHTYFNLDSDSNGDILSHELMINADSFTPVDKTLIPTGELRGVKGTPFDFTKPTAIGARINDQYEQLVIGGGYDHNFVLNNKTGKVALAARAYEPKSGRVLEVLTDQPGVQFYTGNFLDGSFTGKGGKVFRKRYGFCLETQHFPDSPNQPKFPTTTLK